MVRVEIELTGIEMDAVEELADHLREVADRLLNGHWSQEDFLLTDADGHRVGAWTATWGGIT